MQYVSAVDESTFQSIAGVRKKAHLSSDMGERRGFLCGVPPQAGLIGVRNPKACSDRNIFRLWHRRRTRKASMSPYTVL